MRWRVVFYMVGILVFFLGLIMIFPLLYAWYFNDASFGSLLQSTVVTIFIGAALYTALRTGPLDYISQREGMAIVAIGWTAVGLFAAMPFYLCGIFDTFVNAFFESVSGFTTTGASVMTDIEAVPRGILLWRSLIQWLGVWE